MGHSNPGKYQRLLMYYSTVLMIRLYRGIGNLVLQSVNSAPPDTPLHFYSSSGGNAGLACVAAASTLGYPSSVVVPLSTKPFMIDKLREAGATEVIQTGQTWFEADKYLRGEILARDPNGIYVPPFDHPTSGKEQLPWSTKSCKY